MFLKYYLHKFEQNYDVNNNYSTDNNMEMK